MTRRFELALLPIFLSLLATPLVAGNGGVTLKIRLKIITPLAYTNTPLDPTVDFSEVIEQAGASGSP